MRCMLRSDTSEARRDGSPRGRTGKIATIDTDQAAPLGRVAARSTVDTISLCTTTEKISRLTRLRAVSQRATDRPGHRACLRARGSSPRAVTLTWHGDPLRFLRNRRRVSEATFMVTHRG
jgi:hypothetical protein